MSESTAQGQQTPQSETQTQQTTQSQQQTTNQPQQATITLEQKQQLELELKQVKKELALREKSLLEQNSKPLLESKIFDEKELSKLSYEQVEFALDVYQRVLKQQEKTKTSEKKVTQVPRSPDSTNQQQGHPRNAMPKWDPKLNDYVL